MEDGGWRREDGGEEGGGRREEGEGDLCVEDGEGETGGRGGGR
jgi:hypothetical protein